MSRFSIIIPVHDAAQTLPVCLDSVLVDQGNRLEVIAINDGSTDESGKILAAYASWFPLLHVEKFLNNMGISAARTRGLERAKGSYILFADTDDCLLPGVISRLLAAAA